MSSNMSLNIVDFFLDRLFPSATNRKEMAVSKVQAPQKFLGDWTSISQQMPMEFQQVLTENGFLLPDITPFQTSTLSTELFQNFRRILNHNLIVPSPTYPFSPNISKVFKDYVHQMSNCAEVFFDPSSYLSTNSYILSDEVFEKSHSTMYSQSEKNSCDMRKEETSSSVPLTDPISTIESSSYCPNEPLNPCKSEIICRYNLSADLASKKSKELVKRSKKRRRRQKKGKSTMNEYKFSTLDKQLDEVDSSVVSAKNNKSAEHKSEKIEFVCDILNSNYCDKKNSEFINVLRRDSSSNVHILLPDMTSFFISVENISDEDTDWDVSNESDWLPVAEFEVSGLFVTNLTPPKVNVSQKQDMFPLHCTASSTELDEVDKLNAVLCSVNKAWNEATKDLNCEPKAPSKVTFAEDMRLIEVCPVEVYDRKGEWELYALERFRFKRRIDDVEKILAPCFTVEHRTKILQKLLESEL